MNRLLRFSNILAMTIGYAIVAFYGFTIIKGNISREYIPNPSDSIHIGVLETVASACSPRAFNGDGTSMVIWKTYAPQHDLLRTVDRENVELGKIWYPSPFDEMTKKGFQQLTNSPEFEKIKPHIEAIMQSKWYYSIETLTPGNCAIWLLSPDQRLLAYLGEDT